METSRENIAEAYAAKFWTSSASEKGPKRATQEQESNCFIAGQKFPNVKHFNARDCAGGFTLEATQEKEMPPSHSGLLAEKRFFVYSAVVSCLS